MNALTAPDHAALQAFFQSCFGAIEDGWLVLSQPHPTRLTKQGKPALVSTWLDLACTTIPHLVQTAFRLAAQGTLYYGVVVQRPDCEPAQFKRTRAATAYQVPACGLISTWRTARMRPVPCPRPMMRRSTFWQRSRPSRH